METTLYPSPRPSFLATVADFIGSFTGRHTAESRHLAKVLRAIAAGDTPEIEDVEVAELVHQLTRMKFAFKENHGELKVKGDFLSLDPFFERNRDFCRLFLQEAVDGSEDARREYEARRITMYDKAPPYAQRLVTARCKAKLETLQRADISVTQNQGAVAGWGREHRQALVSYLEIVYRTSGLMVGMIGIRGAMTYRFAQRTTAAFQQEYRSSVRATRGPVVDGQISYIFQDRFTPADDSPFGRWALESFKEGAELLLNATILEDLLTGLPLKIPESVKEAALGAAKGAWEIAQSPLVRNARHVAELYQGGLISEETVDSFAFGNRYLLKDPVAELNGLENALHRKRAQDLKKRAADPSRQAPQGVRGDQRENKGLPEVSTPEHKDTFFSAIQMGLGAKVNDRATFQNRYRELYSLYLRGILSVDDCIKEVQTGEAGSAISARIRAHRRGHRHASPCLRLPRINRTEIDSTAASETETSREVGYRIEGRDSDFYTKWFKHLDKDLKDLVTNRLQAAQERGVLYDCHSLSERRLLEFCFHPGAGHRLYFCVPEAGTIVLLGAGPKDQQDHLIGQAKIRLADVLNEWREKKTR